MIQFQSLDQQPKNFRSSIYIKRPLLLTVSDIIEMSLGLAVFRVKSKVPIDLELVVTQPEDDGNGDDHHAQHKEHEHVVVQMRLIAELRVLIHA